MAEIGVFENGPSGKSRGVAALLAIFLGCLGIHYFYLGKNTAGIVFLLVTICSCGTIGTIIGLITLIQGIIMLTMTQDDFEKKYVDSLSSFPLF